MAAKILFVDDDPNVLAAFERQLRKEFSIHTALGVIYSAQGRWISAAEQFRQGLTADDTDPTTLQAYGMNLLGTVGYEQRYIELSLAAHRLAPAWIVPLVHLAVAYLVVGETEASQRYADLLIATGFPRQLGPLNDVLMQLALRAGHPEQASELAISGLPPELVADGADRAIRELFAALHRGSGERTVIAQLDRLRERSIEHPMLRRRFILWYVLVGAFDQAFEILTQSLDHFARSGTIGSAWAFLWMQEMLPFRRDPRFQLICRRLGLFDYWNVFGPPDGTELRAGQLIC